LINLTNKAEEKLASLLNERNDAGVRVGVQGGGCSGFKYILNFEKNPDKNDKILNRGSVKLFVDPKSYLYLMGTEIDYIDSLESSGFKFINPAAKRTCGCGESFSV